MANRPEPVTEIVFAERTLADLTTTQDVVVVLIPEGATSAAAQKLDKAANGVVTRALTEGFKGKHGEMLELRFPQGLATARLILCGTGPVAKFDALAARQLGGKLGARLNSGKQAEALIFAEPDEPELLAELGLGLRLRLYRFERYKSKPEEERGVLTATIVTAAPKKAEKVWAGLSALAEGIELTRDLVNEPANVLTPPNFAYRLSELTKLGIEVKVLGVDELAALGMRALLGVGQGSTQPSRVVVMHWRGGRDRGAAPLCFVGKGVCFDTGGISIKPAAGMEEMTMDMGGAGVVAGLMKALALRKAAANVVGIVGLVENMPDGNAQRPGDIVTAMSGTTIEIINTDAEGRLVLADVLWYAQEQFKPVAMLNLATLTGAIMVALGEQNAGWYANDEEFAAKFATAAKQAGEGAWRMPLGEGYAKQIKSRLADIKNTGGRFGGSITAAEFLKVFVKDGTPWIHVDIAGVTLPSIEQTLAPKGASGWGVASLDQLVRQYES